MQPTDDTTLGRNPSDPLTTRADPKDQALLEDLRGDLTESVVSNPPASFFSTHKTKIKKGLIIFGIIVILTLVIVLPIVLTQKNDDNPPYFNNSLLFQRSFKPGDTFQYVKTGSVCTTPSTSVDAPVPFCQGLKSNFSFHVTDVKDSKSVIPNETQNYKVVSVILHLKELVYENGTDSFKVGGATFTLSSGNSTNNTRRFLSNSYASNSTTDNVSNNSNIIPIIKAELFDNGTIYKVFRPKNLSDAEWNHMKDLISEFSPVLSKQVYSNQNQKQISLSQSVSNSSNEDNNYYEGYGSTFVQPGFNYTSQSNSMLLSKNINKTHFVEMQLPNNSLFSATHSSFMNKSTGFLDYSTITASSTFQRGPTPQLQPDDDTDYFAPKSMRPPRYETNFSDHNNYQNTATGAIQTNTTTNMSLYHYEPDDKNTTLILESLANETEFEEVPRQIYIKNDTKLEELRLWDMKLKKHLDENGNIIRNPSNERLLFNTQSIEELRDRLSEIVYPVFQIDFHGWKAKLLMVLDLHPYDNTMQFEIRLTIDGVFSAALVSKNYPVQLSDSIDKIIAFLYKAYGSIQDLANEFGDLLKFDLGQKIEKFLQEANDIISMPFDIEKIFSDNFSKLGSALQADISNFLTNMETLIENNLVIITNPLTNYTNNFNANLATDVQAFLDDANGFVEIFQNDLKSSFDVLYTLAQNSTHIFPDLIDDVKSMEGLISNGFSTIPNVLTILLQNDYSGHLNELIALMKNLMTGKYKQIVDNLMTSGYSNGLMDKIRSIENKIANSFKEVDDWTTNMFTTFENRLNTESTSIFGQINTTALNLVKNLNNQLENLASFLENKTLQFLELKKYETAFITFQQIHEDFIDFRYKNFSNLFELPLINDNVMDKSMNYLNDFYQNFTEIESFTLDFFNNLKKTIDTTLYTSLQRLNKFKDLINIGLLDQDIGFIAKNLRKNLGEVSMNYVVLAKAKYYEMSQSFLSSVMQKLIHFSNSSFALFNPNKILLCSEERENLIALLSAFDAVLSQLVTDSINYFVSQTSDLSTKLVQSLSINQTQNLAQTLFAQNNLGISSLFYSFEMPINESVVFSEISALINQTLLVVKNDLTAKLTIELAEMKENMSILINNTFNTLTTYSESVACSSKNLTSTVPLINSFCAVYNISAQQVINSDPNIRIVAPCVYEDELVPYMNNIVKKWSFFSPISLTKLDIMTDSITLANQKSVSEIMLTISQSVLNITGLQSAAIYSSLNEMFYNILEIEIKTMNDFLFNSLDEVIANFSNSLTNSTDQLILFFNKNLQDLSNLVNSFNTSLRLPDFLNSNILKHYNGLKQEAQELMNTLKTDSSSKFAFLLEQMALLHSSNNLIILNHFNELAEKMVPFAVLPQVKSSLSSLNSQLESFYGNTTQIRNTLVSTINNRLFVNYQKFSDSFNAFLTGLGSVSSNSQSIIEDLSLNASAGFEYNSYEKLKDLKEVYNTASSVLQGLSPALLNGNLDIVEQVIRKNFLQFPTRFKKVTQTFYDFGDILTDNIAVEVRLRLDEFKKIMGNFTRNEPLLINQLLNYTETFNNTVMEGILSLESSLSVLFDQWSFSLQNKTVEMLTLSNNSLTNKTIQHIQDFISNIMLRSTLSFNSFASSLSGTFYGKLAELKALMKGTYLNNSVVILNNFAASVQTLASKGMDEMLNLDELFPEFKTEALNELDHAIEDALSPLFNRSSDQFNSLETQCQSFFNRVNSKLWQNLLNVQETLDISYNVYAGISWNHSDYTTFRDNKALNFTSNYFDFLQNLTSIFDGIIESVDLSQILSKTSNNISNITSFNDVSFQLNAVSQFSDISRKYINDLLQGFNSSTQTLSVANKANYLLDLMNCQINSILTPVKEFFLSDDVFLNYQNSLNVTLNNLLNVVNGEMLDINSYINTLFNSTGESSLHIVVMLGYFRQLKLNPIPSVLLQNVDNAMQLINKQYTSSFSAIQKVFMDSFSNVTFTNLSNVSLENQIYKQSISNYVENQVPQPIFSALLTQELSNISNILVNPTLIKQQLQTNINSILTNVNSLFDSLLANLKAKLQDLVNQTDSQNIIYQNMLDNFQKIQNFTFKSFNLTQIIYDDVNKFQQAFESQVDSLVNGFISFLNPLNTAMDGLLQEFEQAIEIDDIRKIVDQDVLAPIQSIRQGIMQTCQSVLDSLTDKIIDMANGLLGDDGGNSNSLRVLQTVDIAQLQDVIDFFNNIVVNSVNFVRSLPLVNNIINTYNGFKMLFDGSLVKIIKNLGQNLFSYIQKADEKVIDYLQRSLTEKVTNINNFVQNELSSINGLIGDCTNVIRSFSWDSLKHDLLSLVYKERDKLINFLLSKIAKYGFEFGDDYGHTLHYDIVIPIGPVPLTFGFAFHWDVFYSIGFGVQGLGIYASLKAGASSDVLADAGVGLPWIKVVGYIRGTIAKGEADFSLNYALVNLNAQLQLCFAVSFGETKVGVATSLYLPVSKLVCWVQQVVQNICDAIFLGWLCRDIFKIINVCKWVSSMEWGLWIDFFPPITLFSPHTIHWCPWQKQLG